MRPRNKQKARAKRWGRYLKIAGEAGTIAMSLRDKPTRLDWLGVGLRTVGLAITMREERRRAAAADPWRYFSDVRGSDWLEVPEEFRRLVMDHVVAAEIDELFWDGDDHSPFLCRGRIDTEQVAWIGEGQAIVDGPYIRKTRELETYRALGDRLWHRLGSRHVQYGATGLVLDPFDATGVIATAQMTELAARVRGFLDASLSRSYLLAGQPGTGKSMTIRWLVETLALTSVRIDLGVLARLHGDHSPAIATSLETLLRVLRPCVMILDDLDRVTFNAPLLAFLEQAQRTCKVVIASANSIERMIGAAIRPGRFDDIVEINRLDPAVLTSLLGADADLFDQLNALPAAYVVELMKRRRVLGRERALAELDELIKRCEKIATATD